MTEIEVREDCSGVARKARLRDFNLAFIRGEIEETLRYVAEDVRWRLVGEGTIEGRDGMRAWLESMAGKSARRVVLESVVLDGDIAAVNGTYEMESGSTFEFCDLYEFAGPEPDSPIADYTSYVIRT